MEIDDHPWFRFRGYLHFDYPVGLNDAEAIVSTPAVVAKHSFFPFISYKVTYKKASKDPETGKTVKSTKTRPIAYASHLDSHIYSYYAFNLSTLYEKELKKRGIEKSVLAFRALSKSNIHFANEAFLEIKKIGECAAIAFDVSRFFETIDHLILKKQWEKLLGEQRLSNDHYAVFRSLTKYAIAPRDVIYEEFNISSRNPKAGRKRICSPEEFRNRVRGKNLVSSNNDSFGIPQGSSISALLSNIYMLEFDTKISERTTGIDKKYYRYCDDILLIVPINDLELYKTEIENEIKKLNLRINDKKTHISIFRYEGDKLVANRPLQYLGFLFDGERMMLRSAAITRYYEKMKRGVKLAKLTQAKYNQIRFAKNQEPKALYKHGLFRDYSHLGKRNFITYALRAARIMKSRTIRRQAKVMWSRLQREIAKESE